VAHDVLLRHEQSIAARTASCEQPRTEAYVSLSYRAKSERLNGTVSVGARTTLNAAESRGDGLELVL
jgi:hypothetical protein